MKSKKTALVTIIFCLLFVFAGSLHFPCSGRKDVPVYHHQVNIDFSKKHQSIDGFGVNINPALWENGKLKSTIDLLVEDLGASLFRFDCFGQANWLNPSMLDASGKYPEDYLKKIYSSQVFRDAWETFRYLNSKGIEPVFNVSGAISSLLAGKVEGRTKYLLDFEGYAEMVVSMLEWARNTEHLKFSMIEPFNETDLAQAEGPKIPDENCPMAIQAIADKLKEKKLGDIGIIVMGDFEPNTARISTIVSGQYNYPDIYGFSHHTYGNGMDEDGNQDKFKKFVSAVKSGNYVNARIWMSEYGDLDQTNEYEFGVGWNSTRRLLNFLSLGYNAALVWDAFDNFHAHDSTWTTYGLLKTDLNTHLMSRKIRYYAAKQIYKFVKPGFYLTENKFLVKDSSYVYNWFSVASRLVKLESFISSDGHDFTIVGMNKTDNSIELMLNLNGLLPGILTKKVSSYQTTVEDQCKLKGKQLITNNQIRFMAAPRSIFTLTTLE